MTSVAENLDLTARVSELSARLLCHQLQPGLRTPSSVYLLDAHRRCIAARLRRSPALAEVLADPGWWEVVWCDAVALAAEQTYTLDFPAACPWAMTQILKLGWTPPEPQATPDAAAAEWELPELFTVATLRLALPVHNLPAGTKGTVVELLDADTVMVEFAGADGVAKAIVPVPIGLLFLEPRDADTPGAEPGSLTVRSESSSAHTVQLDYVIFPGPKIIVVTSRTVGGADIIAPSALISLARNLSTYLQIVIWDTDTGEGQPVPSEWRVQLSFASQMLPVRFIQPILGGLAVEISPPTHEPTCLARRPVAAVSRGAARS